MPFYPGPGLGGHCIPIDPFYLSWKAKLSGFEARFIELAGQINGSMPEFVVTKIGDALNRERKSVNGSRVLILGVSYKADIDDIRESPALDIIGLLRSRGADVVFHDPMVGDGAPELDGVERVALDERTVSRCDCVAVITAHSAVDYAAVLRHARTVVDTRNVYGNVRSDKIVRL
jgi:UDP-N-acetyl-D-glucosamine dehydrogenase